MGNEEISAQEFVLIFSFEVSSRISVEWDYFRWFESPLFFFFAVSPEPYIDGSTHRSGGAGARALLPLNILLR